MAGLTLTQVHEYKKVPNSSEVRLVRERPYVRLNGVGATSPIFVQGGKLYYEGGGEVVKVPEWFWLEAEKVSPLMRKSVGLVLPRHGKVG